MHQLQTLAARLDQQAGVLRQRRPNLEQLQGPGARRGSASSSCNPKEPAIASDNTVTLQLFTDPSCCSPAQKFTMGNLNECKDSSGTYGSILQAVGQNMFGRSIHVIMFDGAGCTGNAYTVSLSNNPVCDTGGGVAFKSFMLLQGSSGSSAPPSSPPPSSGCDVSQPKAPSSQLLVLKFYGEDTCCHPKEVFTSLRNTAAGPARAVPVLQPRVWLPGLDPRGWPGPLRSRYPHPALHRYKLRQRVAQRPRI